MAKFLYKMGTFIAKHKWSTLIAWVIIVAAILIPLATNAPKFDNDIKMTGLESLDTNKKIENILIKIVKRHKYVLSLRRLKMMEFYNRVLLKILRKRLMILKR